MRNLLGILIVAAMLAPAAFATSGTRGGGFVDFSPKENLIQLKTDLATRLRALPARAFDEDTDLKVPSGWTTQRIADVIENLQINSSAQSLNVEGNGRLKLLDYNEKNGTIIALASFFLYYGRDLSKFPVPADLEHEVKQKLVHEVAHLFGFGDEEANLLARRLMNKIETDLVSCNFYQIINGKKEYRHIAYSFSKRGAYVRSGSVGTNNDDALLSTNEAAKNFIMFSGVDFSVGQTSLVITSGDQYELVVNRAVDDDYVTTGFMKGQDHWADSVPAQTVECVIPNPR